MSKAKSLKNYLSFIPLRLAYLRIGNMRYSTGKIDIKKYNAFYKKSERTSYRILSKQCNKCIEFIKRKEIQLGEIYPFDIITPKEITEGE